MINKKPKKVGSITWFFSSSDLNECCISTIIVLPPYRGRGIATKLLRSVLAKNPQKRFKAIILGGTDNIQSYKLFLRAGFTNHNHNEDDNAFIMIKSRSD